MKATLRAKQQYTPVVLSGTLNRNYYNPSQAANLYDDGARDWLAWL